MIAIQECFENAVLVREFNDCLILQNKYIAKYGGDSSQFFVSLQSYGYDAYLEVYECYLTAKTTLEVEKCNQLAAALESSQALVEVTLNNEEKARLAPLVSQAIGFIAQGQAQLRQSKQIVNAHLDCAIPKADAYLTQLGKDLEEIQKMLAIKTLISLQQVEDEESIAEAIAEEYKRREELFR